jgi:GTPase SAR1 family protein
MKKFLQKETLVAIATSIITIMALGATIAELTNLTSLSSSKSLLYYLLTAAVLTSTLVILTFIRTTTEHPRSLSVALIGPSGAGKTVYLTMLYRELEMHTNPGLTFAPYGYKTIEEINRNLNYIQNGTFPPSTELGAHFRYEALALYGNGILKRRFRLQIVDYAGEHLDEFNISSDKWLHRSEFFDYVLSSDALIIMLDCERLLAKDETNLVHNFENVIVATLHTLIQERSKDPTKLFDNPVALVFSKSDLIKSKEDKEYIIQSLARLISICKTRFRYFRYFYVSSIGSTPVLDNQGVRTPPKEIIPIGVVEPILWLLGH